MMKRKRGSVEALVRHAFDLLLEIRQRPEAPRLLTQVIGYLQSLVKEGGAENEHWVVCVRAVRIRGE